MTLAVSEPPAAPPNRLAYPVREASRLLGIGKTTCWQLIDSGALRHIRVNRRVLVPRSAMEEFIAGQLSGGSRR